MRAQVSVKHFLVTSHPGKCISRAVGCPQICEGEIGHIEGSMNGACIHDTQRALSEHWGGRDDDDSHLPGPRRE